MRSMVRGARRMRRPGPAAGQVDGANPPLRVPRCGPILASGAFCQRPGHPDGVNNCADNDTGVWSWGHESGYAGAKPSNRGCATCRETPASAAIFAALLASAGLRFPPVSRCGAPGAEGRLHRRPGRAPATDRYRAQADAAAAAIARKLHARRHRDLLPERDLAGGQGRSAGRVARRLHGPRQRLAEHVPRRPLPADPERVRAQPERRRRATTPTSTSARRRSATRSSSPRTRSSCSTTSATPAATPSPGCPRARSRRPSSGSTTTPPASSAPALPAVIAEA